MFYNARRLIIFLIIISLLTACRSTKKLQHVITIKRDSVAVHPGPDKFDSAAYMSTLYKAVLHNRIDFKTFSAKVKVDFEGRDGKKSDFNAFFKLKKDSCLWVSINALLGIEAFRILITPDSVKVLNKVDKIAQLRSVSYIRDIAKIPFSFKELQDIIVGNPIYFDSNMVSFKKTGNTISVISIGDLFKHLLTINASDFVALHSKLDDVDAVRARTADITYGEYETRNGMSFSTFRKIAVSEKSKLDIEMKYKQFDFNEPLNFPFNIPKNYKLQ